MPKPRVHLTRYHGVLAPHSALRAAVTPAGRGQRIGATVRSPAEQASGVSADFTTAHRARGPPGQGALDLG